MIEKGALNVLSSFRWVLFSCHIVCGTATPRTAALQASLSFTTFQSCLNSWLLSQ